MDLREAGIGEQRTLLMGAPYGRGVRPLCVGGEIEYIAVTTSCQNHGIAEMGADSSAYQVARDDAPGFAIDHDQVKHFVAWKHCDAAGIHLALQRLIGAQQQLLSGLASGVEGA